MISNKNWLKVTWLDASEQFQLKRKSNFLYQSLARLGNNKYKNSTRTLHYLRGLADPWLDCSCLNQTYIVHECHRFQVILDLQAQHRDRTAVSALVSELEFSSAELLSLSLTFPFHVLIHGLFVSATVTQKSIAIIKYHRYFNSKLPELSGRHYPESINSMFSSPLGWMAVVFSAAQNIP